MKVIRDVPWSLFDGNLFAYLIFGQSNRLYLRVYLLTKGENAHEYPKCK